MRALITAATSVALTALAVAGCSAGGDNGDDSRADAISACSDAAKEYARADQPERKWVDIQDTAAQRQGDGWLVTGRVAAREKYTGPYQAARRFTCTVDANGTVEDVSVG